MPWTEEAGPVDLFVNVCWQRYCDLNGCQQVWTTSEPVNELSAASRPGWVPCDANLLPWPLLDCGMPRPDPASRRGRYSEGLRNDAVVLEAARDVFSSLGAGATVAAVASRAGLGIGSLYRRYGSKEELLQRLCVLAMEEVIEVGRVWLLEEDPWEGLVGYVRACVRTRSGALTPLAGSVAVTQEMRRVSAAALNLCEQIVARAHADGRLRDDVQAVDITLLLEQFSRRRPTASDPREDAVRDRLLAISLAGLRRHDSGDEPLPGEPPTREWYRARWSGSASQGEPHRPAGTDVAGADRAGA